MPSPPRWLLVAAGFAIFAIVATANSAGYRYGASDQAFYLPAAARVLDPALFPHDAALLDTQAWLTAADEILAVAFRTGRAIGLHAPAVVAIAYLGSLLFLYLAALAFGRALDGSLWTGAALAAMLALRHAVPYSGVNTLEAYFHPRLVVFAAGVLGLAWMMRGRIWQALTLTAVSMLLHPTTALWFLIWIGVAVAISHPPARRPLAICAAVAMVLAAWAVTSGPLNGRLVRMDPEWLAAIGAKDYLFPDRWPAYAWLVNLAYPLLIGVLLSVRRRSGQLTRMQLGIGLGAIILFLIFLASLPYNAERIALVVQLQVPRIFWMLDFFATALIVSWLVQRTKPRAVAVTSAIALAAVLRGLYIMTIEFPERPLVPLDLPDDDWKDAMRWARATPTGTHWLVHPGHTYRYGSSVRIAADRDVFHEEVKDAAVAMYDRQVAARVLERATAIGDFSALDALRARDLAARYDLDYLVTESRHLDLPGVYANARFVIYDLR
ncbi:MAG TPA: hypothetical protein VHJ77_00780 [Vicinamibacterales bacterium]|nr:hypothetical protein [Vicinamibacterales bacterium]